MSEREARVIKIKMEPHGNADSLSVVRIDGFVCVVRTADWTDGQLAVYVPPDEIVDTERDEFTWLNQGRKHERVKARKFRGVWSMGLLTPAPEGSVEGDNLYEQLGLIHYEPELDIKIGGRSIKTPDGFGSLSKYDIENGRGKSRHLFTDGEPVFIQEKIHGANMSVVFTDDKLCVHSRTQWPEEEEDSLFWKAVRSCPGIEEFCMDNPGVLIYGEAYGFNKGFKYDCVNGEIKFRCFDIMLQDRTFVNSDVLMSICSKYSILIAPLIKASYQYNFDDMLVLAQDNSRLGNPVMEGVVVRPVIERVDPKYGRVIAKFINPVYLEKN